MNENSVQSFKKISFALEIFSNTITETNEWIFLNCLKTYFCPDFTFNFYVQRPTKNKLNIKVTKAFSKPATVLIELTVNLHTIRKYDTYWTKDVILDNFSTSHDCSKCFDVDDDDDDDNYNNHRNRASKSVCKYKIPVTCSIIWYGFNDDLLSTGVNKYIRTYLKNAEFSDVKILAKNNEEFPAHKVILASNSSVFEKMLTTDMKESKENCINLPELDFDTVNELLYFFYHGELNEIGDNSAILLKLVEAADMYSISELKRVCDALLSKHLSCENVFSLLEKSGIHNLLILRQQALLFIADNLNSLFPEEM